MVLLHIKVTPFVGIIIIVYGHGKMVGNFEVWWEPSLIVSPL
jgi:hypothetical protein